MENKNYIIAIDGMAATGKTSLAKEVAKRLNIMYIDTGAMYRACGLYFLQRNIDITEENVEKYINDIEVVLKIENEETYVYLNGEDVTSKIRDSKVSWAASVVSKFKPVREKLVELQRKMAQNGSVILEGRDIGTAVFPNATLKIFLTASKEIRAIRRQKDYEKKGEFLDIYTIMADMEKRDIQDSTRTESPLVKAVDAIEIDTTPLTNDTTAEMVIKLLNERI